MAKNVSTDLDGKQVFSSTRSLSITDMRPALQREWDMIWKNCNYSTYFHSREWAEIWSCYTKGKMSLTPFLVEFSDGNRALLPFSCLTKEGVMPILIGTRRLYVSSPECTYGGWISADKLDCSHALLLLNLVERKFNNLFWRMNPYDNIALESGVRISDEGETHAINLEKGFDVIASNMSRDHRRGIKKAIENGVSVRIASSIKDWLDYYQVYEITVRRWGNRLLGDKYSWELFHDIFRRNSPNVELWLAIYEDKVVSGELCFHSKNHFVCWHGASLEAYFSIKPRHLLLFEAIKNACEKGYFWFDFNPSAGLKGVTAFKEGFGAEVLKCPIVELRSKNMRTFALEKVTDKIIEMKKWTNCNLSKPLF
jgi:Acetyltransferase (GNAT) domain